eukprot:TRINITY_DN5412_c0_g1_i1.p1 TRINITY_DN5412_c0_g1~~TRINITY_DN5412_c0_g1_i1.p1  ORF type:complete len:422 (+),score=131.21 TRINITY_DN5412_c0_g1_i1:79-1344(+)
MQIKVKTTTRLEFVVDVEPSETVSVLREKVIAAHPPYANMSCRLILAGTVLKDETLVSELKVSDTSFLVAMPMKKKATSSPPAAQVAPAQPTPVTPPVPAVEEKAASVESKMEAEDDAEEEKKEEPKEEKNEDAKEKEKEDIKEEVVAPSTVDAAASALVSDEAEISSTVMQLMEISGKDKETCDKALYAAYGNPDRAVEYLFSDHIPERAAPVMQPMAGPGMGAQAHPGMGEDSGMGDDEEMGGFGELDVSNPEAAFEALRNNPQFNALRFLCQSNPAITQPLIGQIAASHPGMLQLIRDNGEQFMAFLQEPLTEEQMAQATQESQRMMGPAMGSADAASAAVGAPGMGEPGMGEPGMGEAPQGALPPNTIQVTEAEKAAIERLCELGFPREAAIQAYFACDKNEEMAANFLLSTMDDYM